MSEFEQIDIYDETININDNDDFDVWNIKSIISHINSNKLGFLLLCIVFFIIYAIDYINNLNSGIFGMSNSVPIPGIQNTLPIQLPKNFKRKTKNNKI